MVEVLFIVLCMNMASAQELPSDVDHLLQWPLQHGFPFAEVIQENPDSSMLLERGDAWVWGRVRRLGEGNTQEYVIQSLSLLEPGLPVNLYDLPRARNRLRRSGWFSDVSDAKLFRYPNRNQLIPAFRITEDSQNSAEGWFTYQSQENGEGELPWTGHIAVSLQNISGTGRNLQVSGETGSEERRAEASYREPFILGTHSWLDLNGGMWQPDSESRKVWGSFVWTNPIDFEWDISLGGGASDAKNANERAQSRWGSVGVSRDGRDQLPFARRGWMWSSTWSGGVRKADTSMTFAKLSAEWGIWIPIWNGLGWVNRSSAEGLWPRDGAFFETELLRLGGEKLAGYWPGSLMTQGYCYDMVAFQWTGFRAQTQLFVEIAKMESLGTRLSYGASWSQDVQYAIVGVILGWSEDARFGEALLSMHIQTRF